ncbi:hypothetical protein DPQ25_10595 [Hydrogeniiclostridium mannosilyticum]|uniref:Uncharacterized protein n=1 Tax=Hydrogeniiclostridium mannosilyticum TaxID=2764322 RepID=A0A328UEZ7_9FIRM|nr:hypothetical protein DPQ25_10595 [Hydrogeniiclostridium mannosilyticum]
MHFHFLSLHPTVYCFYYSPVILPRKPAFDSLSPQIFIRRPRSCRLCPDKTRARPAKAPLCIAAGGQR